MVGHCEGTGTQNKECVLSQENPSEVIEEFFQNLWLLLLLTHHPFSFYPLPPVEKQILGVFV